MSSALVKVALILVAIGLYLVGEFLIELNKKVDITLAFNRSYHQNAKALKGTACLSCHDEPKYHLPRSRLELQDFIKYVRGSKRHISNNTMPKFTASQMSDQTLTKIYFALYKE